MDQDRGTGNVHFCIGRDRQRRPGGRRRRIKRRERALRPIVNDEHSGRLENDKVVARRCGEGEGFRLVHRTVDARCCSVSSTYKPGRAGVEVEVDGRGSRRPRRQDDDERGGCDEHDSNCSGQAFRLREGAHDRALLRRERTLTVWAAR